MKLCDQFDAEMAKPRRFGIDLRYPDPTPMRELRRRMRDVVAALGDLVEDESVEDLIKAQLATEPGRVPEWSRPGKFMLWLGFVPIACGWDGFPCPGARLIPVAPRTLFMSEYGAFGMNEGVAPESRTVEAHFREYLLAQTQRMTWHKHKHVPAFELVPLHAEAQHQAAEYAAANPWVEPALRRGPLNAVPLPPHIQAVQLAL